MSKAHQRGQRLRISRGLDRFVRRGLRGSGPLMFVFLRAVVWFLAARLVKAAEND
jgi:hypothetical protein